MDTHDLPQKGTKYLTFEGREDIGSNPSENPTMGDVINARLGRRDMMRGMLSGAAVSALIGPAALLSPTRGAEAAVTGAPRPAKASFSFQEVAHGVDADHHVASGYNADILIRWGDPVVPGAPAFDPMNQTAEAQSKQFGYNNDFVGYAPLPLGSRSPDRALLCVNHEYTDEEVMFPGVGVEQQKDKFARMTKALVDIEMAAHGGTVVEIRKVRGKWVTVADSRYNRRITGETACAITGPAAGHALMKTSYDPTGTMVRGMLNNCSGGMTPWGTWLSAEENFNGYFWGKVEDTNPNAKVLKRYGFPGEWYNWGVHHDRFDIAKEPNESNRFGWIVEIDPYDPTSTPKKRTALGRFKHEACQIALGKDGTVVAYTGDDERFDYVYKFVAAKKFDPRNRAANMDILETGTLYVAKFKADASVEWLPLVHGQGPLTAEKGFPDQATVLINARLAADALGATKMDRPEDIEVNAVTGKVYVILTNNSRRKPEQVDATNPRAENNWGHIVEILPDNGNHAATKAEWTILVRGGNPADGTVGAQFHADTSANGWFSCPDNAAVDHRGRLWITTDQGENWKKASGTADGVWAVETEGNLRGLSKMFYRVPVGAEMCGPCFTTDDKTLFVAVQHPATDGVDQWEGFKGKLSSFEDPATRWPDFKPNMPPRPSVVAITKKDGGVIGL
ncbi:PhoX family phosphatase [Azospirillum brasilense]|uniref:PhoX family phosphatase n=2 Tax=Azospirillum brasilense TaxID=192 RepID=A0A0P0EZ49_AZOBR|nr:MULTISPECIES: PhoX family phosphatase [Azospirillum]ALJ35556.1 dTDP-glucose 4,6-dehydratase [Azospirillum brasilense]MDW7555577.1 PhoX family phosphatase [Azospirillum brasilense]MDW7595504.1 PhoX family phosphatase [Azospirillum brasilense]MDW7630509.1 PhoX family phosphatase [Azospirillum brasilense]MDX5954295.1 PhoX family phosphatase [Azospirillum brasilense]